MSDDNESPFVPPASRAHSRRQRQPSVNPLLVVLLVGGGLTVAVAIGWFAFSKSDAPKEVVKAEVTVKQPVAPVPIPANKGKGQPVTASPIPKDTTPKPPPTFDEAMSEAATLANQLDRDEPEKTRKALTLLTAEERVSVQLYITQPEYLRLRESRNQLLKVGLGECLAKFSRSEARNSNDFTSVARKLWVPATGAVGIVEMMNQWGRIDGFTQAVIVNATTNDLPTANLTTEARNAILDLGGRAWLSR